jgi:hypothetical protein
MSLVLRLRLRLWAIRTRIGFWLHRVSSSPSDKSKSGDSEAEDSGDNVLMGMLVDNLIEEAQGEGEAARPHAKLYLDSADQLLVYVAKVPAELLDELLAIEPKSLADACDERGLNWGSRCLFSGPSPVTISAKKGFGDDDQERELLPEMALDGAPVTWEDLEDVRSWIGPHGMWKVSGSERLLVWAERGAVRYCFTLFFAADDFSPSKIQVSRATVPLMEEDHQVICRVKYEGCEVDADQELTGDEQLLASQGHSFLGSVWVVDADSGRPKLVRS